MRPSVSMGSTACKKGSVCMISLLQMLQPHHSLLILSTGLSRVGMMKDTVEFAIVEYGWLYRETFAASAE